VKINYLNVFFSILKIDLFSRRTENVSKAVVDAATKSLVQALDERASQDSSYLKR
jgi:hypothetical protein